MQVHSLHKANTPLLQSITLPPQINSSIIPNSPFQAICLSAWGQRTVCGTKPTQGTAVDHPSLMECKLFTWLSTPIIPTLFLFSTWVMQAKLFVTGLDTVLPKASPSLLQHWKPLIKHHHGISACMFGPGSGCPSGLWKIPLEDGIPPGTWAGSFGRGQKSQTLFLSPLGYCQDFPSQVKDTAVVPLLRAAAPPWAQTLFHNHQYKTSELNFSFVSGQIPALFFLL